MTKETHSESHARSPKLNPHTRQEKRALSSDRTRKALERIRAEQQRRDADPDKK